MDIADLQEFQSTTHMHEKKSINDDPKHRVLDRIGNIHDRLNAPFTLALVKIRSLHRISTITYAG